MPPASNGLPSPSWRDDRPENWRLRHVRIEVINTGTELLLGQVINTHLAFLGEQLLLAGLRIQRQTCIPDGAEIGSMLREAFPRADVLLITGGLGPTSDDITREIIADLLDLPLELNESVVSHIRAIFRRYGREMTESNQRQAMVPRGSLVLENPRGTAPGLYFPALPGSHPHLFVLPGPPRELKPMFEDQVLPRLRELAGSIPGSFLSHRTFRLVGVGESHVAECVEAPLRELGGLEIGYCARMGEVDVRLIGSAELIDRGEAVIRQFFPNHLVGSDGATIEETLVRLLRERRLWLATAESCTGGLIADKITNVPGSSEIYRQGYVTYANEAKTELLGVPAEVIREHGAVSEPVARLMVEGALDRAGVDHAVAVTGIAGPGGGTPEKPVGTVYIAQAAKGQTTFVRRFSLAMDRLSFKERTARMALELVRRRVLGLDLEA